jgi:D-ribose pyranase
MKKTGILNSDLSSVISKMGHTDMLAIGDCGLPIPDCTKRIDLALKKNMPSFIDTLEVALTELHVEEIILAEEIRESNRNVFEQIKSLMDGIKITFVSHEELKALLKDCKAVVRTGEQSHFANIILKSGVIF